MKEVGVRRKREEASRHDRGCRQMGVEGGCSGAFERETDFVGTAAIFKDKDSAEKAAGSCERRKATLLSEPVQTETGIVESGRATQIVFLRRKELSMATEGRPTQAATEGRPTQAATEWRQTKAAKQKRQLGCMNRYAVISLVPQISRTCAWHLEASHVLPQES